MAGFAVLAAVLAQAGLEQRRVDVGRQFPGGG
jgi:hypothetical protein